MVTILKSEVQQAREGMYVTRRAPRVTEEPEWWSFDLVKEWLVDASALWRRSPGHGANPFATDGPWSQMSRQEGTGDWDARGVGGTSSDVPIRPRPLNTEEVARRDRISEWMTIVPSEEDRRLIITACWYLARGDSRVPWRRIKHEMGIRFGEDGLRRRFERAVQRIAETLNTAR